jgi:hypothetical protein
VRKKNSNVRKVLLFLMLLAGWPHRSILGVNEIYAQFIVVGFLYKVGMGHARTVLKNT